MIDDKSPLGRAVDHAVLLAGVLFLIAPIVLLAIGSTQSTADLGLQGLGFDPGGSALENYTEVLTLKAGFTDQISALAMLKNSLLVALSLATLTTAFSLAAAYAMVYFQWPLASLFFWLTMLTLLLPLESRFVTTFQVAATLGMVNTLPGMVLPALALALGTLFFRQLFRSFPEEYLEAAKLDGAGPLRFLVDFILPLSWQRGGALFVVSFMIGWHQYLWPVMLSTDETTYTVVRGLSLIGLESGPGMALAVLTLLPPLLLVVLFQRYFFRSLAEAGNPF